MKGSTFASNIAIWDIHRRIVLLLLPKTKTKGKKGKAVMIEDDMLNQEELGP